MLSLTLDVIQYDCPFISVSESYDVSVSGLHWDFDTAARNFKTRVMVRGADRGALDNALGVLRDHEAINECELLARREEEALIRHSVAETDAMETIRNHDGYLTGPYEARNGTELWHVGFDQREQADRALSDLERNNEFTVENRDDLSFVEYFDVIKNVDTSKSVLDAMRSLTDTERETLLRALERGYFDAPREATVTDLAEEFDISTTGVSKNIRRGERKLLAALLESVEDVSE